MPTTLTVVILVLVLNVVLAAALLVHLLRRRLAMDGALMIVLATALCWSLGYAVEIAADSAQVMLLAARLQYFAYVAGPVGWFLLALHLHGRLEGLGRHLLLALWLVPAITLMLALTSAYQTWFIAGHDFIALGGRQVVTHTYGPLFWLHIAYSYSLMLVAAGLIISALFSADGFYLRQRVALAIALVLPWLANAAYVFRLYEPAIDFTSVAIGISCALLVLDVFRLRLGEVVPVARERLVQVMRDGVLVLDSNQRVADFNRSLKALLDSVAVGEPASSLLADHPKLQTVLARQQENLDFVYAGFDEAVYRVSSELIGPPASPSRLVTFHDLSGDSRIENALRLVLEGTAGYVGDDYFRSLVRSLAGVLDARFAMVAEIDREDPGRAHTLAVWQIDVIGENFSYRMSESPCRSVADKASTHLEPGGVRERFPVLGALGIEAYLGTPLMSHDGKVIGILAVMDVDPFTEEPDRHGMLDIFALRAAAEIERRHNESLLQRSERNYRRIVETTRDGVCVVDDDGIIEFVNEPMARLLGRRRAGVQGRALLELFKADALVKSRLLAGDELDLEFSMETSGSIRWVSVKKTAMADAHRHRYLYVFADQTEQQQLEEKNRGIEEQLRHAQKLESLGALAGGVAHDFNNLLMPILGYLDLIRQRDINDDAVIEYLEKIQTAGGKLADLCNQMLTYSGKGHHSETIVAINDKLGEMHDLARASVSRHLRLEYRLGEGVPMIRADATQLTQAVMNLLLNASEAMNDRDGAIVVSSGVELLNEAGSEGFLSGDSFAPGEYVFVRVTDAGVGMSDEDLKRLFEPFYSTKFTGRGLGMAVVYGIVRAHNGALRVSSTAGVGTTVTVYFPSLAGNAQASLPLAGEVDAAHRGRVLVVDDEPFVRDLLKGMLENIGYEVLEAEDGATGLAAFSQQQDIEACVVDLTMPGMGGAELLSRLRDIDPNVPVLLVSGYSHQEFTDQDTAGGNVGFLQKPFTLEQFKTAFAERIAGRVVH